MSGKLYVVAAPSGAGKTTLVRLLLDNGPGVHLSISYTTRAPRPGEADGREYHFVDVATFRAMMVRGDFLEWAEVHGNFYGTSKVWIGDQLAAGHDVLLEIDWQGAQQVRAVFPEAIGVFILPPSKQALRERLGGRGQDSEAVIERRMRDAVSEMVHYVEYDFLVVNDRFEDACEELGSLITAHRLQVGPQSVRLQGLLRDLLD